MLLILVHKDVVLAQWCFVAELPPEMPLKAGVLEAAAAWQSSSGPS